MRIGPSIGIPGDAAAAGGFSPAQLSGLVLWLRADLGITLNGGNVSAWADQSGLGNHITQGTASLQPLFVASGPNGKPAIRPDGADDFLKGTFTLSQPYTVFMPFKWLTLTASGAQDVAFDGSTANAFVVVDNGPRTAIFAGSTLSYAAIPENGAYVIFGFGVNGASSFIRSAGSQVASGAAGGNNPGGLTLGALTGGTRAGNFETPEIIIYNRIPSAGEIAAIENYLKIRYAL
jgi:hypothetical protein